MILLKWSQLTRDFLLRWSYRWQLRRHNGIAFCKLDELFLNEARVVTPSLLLSRFASAPPSKQKHCVTRWEYPLPRTERLEISAEAQEVRLSLSRWQTVPFARLCPESRAEFARRALTEISRETFISLESRPVRPRPTGEGETYFVIVSARHRLAV